MGTRAVEWLEWTKAIDLARKLPYQPPMNLKSCLLFGLLCLSTPLSVFASALHDSRHDSRFTSSCEERLVSIPAKQRRLTTRTSYLPYFSSYVDLIQVGDSSSGPLQYVITLRGGDSQQFSTAEMFDFWLSEILFERDMNYVFKLDRMQYGMVGRMPRRMLRVTVNRDEISQDDAESLLMRFIYSMVDLDLVTYNWKLNINESRLLPYLRTLPGTDHYLNSELMQTWTDRFARFYANLSTRDRLLLTRNFFDPATPLSKDEAYLQKYLFQGNRLEQLRVLDGMRAGMAAWFREIAPHLRPSVAVSMERGHVYTPNVSLSGGARLSNGKHIIDSGTADLDPHVTVARLDVSEGLLERLSAHGFDSPDQFQFLSAEDLVNQLSMTRQEFVDLAEALFEEGLFLKIESAWDKRHWKVLDERTYLRMPRRMSPRDGVDRSPVPRPMYGEFK